jgi:feruloyl-CoA synthase
MRDVHLGPIEVTLERPSDGTILVHPVDSMGTYPDRLTERLLHWAEMAPERTFMAKRGPDGSWRELSYGRTLGLVRNIGQALLDRGLAPERPVAILSGNDLEHALLGLACLHVGVPYAPISPPYALVSSDFGKLRHVLGLLTPGLVFAADGAAFERALRTVVPEGVESVVTDPAPEDLGATRFEELAATPATPAVEAAFARVGPDTVAKILFTSGSTGMPKGVICPQRMLTSNQEMLAHYFAFLRVEPPVLVDWLPWNHTFGGNHNVGIVLYNGGSLYIDDGKPTPRGTETTVRNLREIAPSIYFNVPKGFEVLLPYLRAEKALRERFFSRLQVLFYSGAGMPRHVWDELEELAVQTIGARVPILTGLGSTETGPFALVCPQKVSRPGVVGLPVPGVELKLVPNGGKLEARVKSPSVTPGYWRQPELTAKMFDEEGWYSFGDALRFVDPEDPSKGFYFDGRVSEDFKLVTGTWVSVGTLRANLISHMAPFVSDVVIAGHDRDDIRVLIFPDLFACRNLCPDFARDAAPAELLRRPEVRDKFQSLLSELARTSTGSSTRVVAGILLDEPPSLDLGEITDKGSINQRAALTHRAALVEELYTKVPGPRVIVARA